MKLKVAFVTELNFQGKVPDNYTNIRTEFAWMKALNADHYNFNDAHLVKDYDWVLFILPKGLVTLNAQGIKMGDGVNVVGKLLVKEAVNRIFETNKKIGFIQEGAHWWFTEYELEDQFLFMHFLSKCDLILAHNKFDVNYYKGLFPEKRVEVIPTLLIESLVSDIKPTYENKVMIGGNFARWYGGFESYIIANEFNLPIFNPTSHAARIGESSSVYNLKSLPWMDWLEWMKTLSQFKYTVHLMPTVAAGTFSLNCAYFGIPCIGNINVDTQRVCFPNLSVEVNDLVGARMIANQLKDRDFWKEQSILAKTKYNFFNQESFIRKMNNILADDDQPL
jgi:hypothetical protein